MSRLTQALAFVHGSPETISSEKFKNSLSHITIPVKPDKSKCKTPEKMIEYEKSLTEYKSNDYIKSRELAKKIAKSK